MKAERIFCVQQLRWLQCTFKRLFSQFLQIPIHGDIGPISNFLAVTVRDSKVS
jgi:hypothetical protein